MAKKKKKADQAKSVDLDKSSTEDAPEQDEAPVVPDGDEAAAEESGGSAAPADAKAASERRFWPVEDDHGSITRLLTGAADKDVDLDDYDHDHDTAAGGGSMTLNLVLMILIIAATGVGIWQLVKISSPEALAAKSEARKALEEAHLAEQLAKQKKYGVLRIESEPPQAVVIKDGEKLVAEVAAATAPPEEGAPEDGKAPEGAPADGKDVKEPPKPPEKAPEAPADGKAETPPAEDGASTTKVGMTPMNIMNLDISKTYTIRLEKDGYEPFEFSIAEHLWTKDPTTGEYKFFKPVELTPINCEYWFLYNAKKRREVKFEQKADCFTHYEESLSQQVSVTECVCKIPPEGVNPEKAPE